MSKDKDFTRIEELSAFEHPEDSDDSLFSKHEEDLGQSPFDNTNVSHKEETAQNDEPLFENTVAEEETSIELTSEENTFTPFSTEPTLEQAIESKQEFVTAETSTDLDEDLFTPMSTVFEEEKVTEEHHRPYEEMKENLAEFNEAHQPSELNVTANPPFSVALTNIKYKEDSETIAQILEELGLLTAENKNESIDALKNGAILVPQISEYLAIILVRRLRHISAEIKMGLSQEIFKSTSYKQETVGLTSKLNLGQNTLQAFEEIPENLSVDDVIITTENTLQGYTIIHYYDVATEHALLSSRDLEQSELMNQSENNEINQLYRSLAEKLKVSALKKRANAVIGLSYQLSPLNAHEKDETLFYKVTAIGNIVVVRPNKL